MTPQATSFLEERDLPYRQLFEIHPHPMWIYDQDTLKFLAVNAAASAKYGYSCEEFLAMTIRDIRPVEEVPRLLENVASNIEGLERSGLWHHRLKDGRIIYVEITSHDLEFEGNPAKIVWAHDVTQLKDSEEKARRLAKRLETTLNSITEGFYTLDRDWRFTYLNPAAERTLHIKRDDALGQVVWDVFKESTGTAFYREYHRAMAEMRTVTFQEYYAPLRGWFEAWVYPSEEGLAVYFLDITKARELEEKLRQAQRLEAVGQLTGGVAHDFNNLLTVILGNSDFLESALSGSEELRPLAEMTRMAAERGAELTRHLLAFSRRQPLEPGPVDVLDLLSNMQGMLRRTLGEQVEIRLACSDDTWQAFVDRAQLESAVLNLCINARDAMPMGGRLTIESSNIHLSQGYADWSHEVASGDYVMLAVSDTGTGMAADVVARAFEPFFTTKEVGKGSGLGLSMVYGLVKQSGGHVNIYSELHHGTTIKLYLPKAGNGSEPVSDTRFGGDAPGGSEMILLVEDNDLVRAHVSGLLRSLGYSVITAASGVEAAELLAQPRPFDLLLTDVIMPGGIDGRQLAERARVLRPNLPVLFASGYSENSIVHHGRLDLGVHLVNKPFRRGELAEKVRQVLRTSAVGANR
jgi:PAS domain S-box-containing protein